MAQAWPSGVGTGFYALETGVSENTKSLSFECGKKRTYLLNSSPKRTFKVSLDIWTEKEESAFWTWYADVIKSGSLSFVLTDFIDGKTQTEYRLTSTPSTEGQYPKTLTLEMEEV